MIDQNYYAWFHWPIYRSAHQAQEVTCDCGD
jgi:hypothetical protein